MEPTDVEPFPRDREVNRRWAPAKIGAVTSVTVIGLLAAWQTTGMLDRWDARSVAACQQSSPPQACYPMHVPLIAMAVWGLIGAALIYGPVGRRHLSHCWSSDVGRSEVSLHWPRHWPAGHSSWRDPPIRPASRPSRPRTCGRPLPASPVGRH